MMKNCQTCKGIQGKTTKCGCGYWVKKESNVSQEKTLI